MSDDSVIPFWGPQETELFSLMTQAIDPDGLIASGMEALAPIDGRWLLDIGAGVGDRTIQYADSAEHVYALEPDPKALPILRGRIKSSGATNVTVLPGSASQIPLDAGTVEVAYSTWAYFFGPGSEPGLHELERVLRPGGQTAIVQNYGRDELSTLWTPDEAKCESWSAWFEGQGFACEVVDTVWSFSTPEEAASVLEFLWGAAAGAEVRESSRSEFGYKVAIYHRQAPSP
jgi:SAM-dependent methyltransferase